MIENLVVEARVIEAKQDSQKATPDGKPLIEYIDGVKVRMANTLVDERGTLCEILNLDWNFEKSPITHVYQFTVRPKVIKGWVVHLEQDDRFFISQGSGKIVLYDDRPESPTYRMINEICLSKENRGLVLIPKFVFHAVQNIGTDDLLCINLPTKAYNHKSPDKFRLPFDTDLIPYKWK